MKADCIADEGSDEYIKRQLKIINGWLPKLISIKDVDRIISNNLLQGATEICRFDNYDMVQQMNIDDVYEVGYLNDISLLGD